MKLSSAALFTVYSLLAAFMWMSRVMNTEVRYVHRKMLFFSYG